MDSHRRDPSSDKARTLRVVEGASAAPTFAEIKMRTEALLFAAEGALEAADIRAILGEVSLHDVKLALKDLDSDYENRAFYLHESGGKYQIRTRDDYLPFLKKLFQNRTRSLSRSSLETLAIIAYKQPVTRGEINAIRSVDSASIVASLKEKGLIEVAGQRRELGSPLEYRTTKYFLEVFGLDSLQSLPSLRSLQIGRDEEKRIGEALRALKEEGGEPTLEESEPTVAGPTPGEGEPLAPEVPAEALVAETTLDAEALTASTDASVAESAPSEEAEPPADIPT